MRFVSSISRFFSRITVTQILCAASGLSLVALALMVWSVIVPTPLPVMLAMSLGQVLGTGSLAMYGVAIWIDLRRVRRARRLSLQPPLGPPGPSPIAVPPPGPAERAS